MAQDQARRIALLGLVALVGCAEGSAEPGRDLPSDRLDAAIEAWAQGPDHRGVSAAVILPDGEEWVGAAGEAAPDEALSPEGLIWIASITKTMTGAVIQQLAEEGAVELDAPLSRYLDPLENVDPTITLRQLLNHTNNLANYTAGPALNQAIGADAGHVFTARELLTFLGPRAFEPGARTQYTNTAFLLLGLVAEEVTGRSIVELYHERLWDPLGLDEIFLPGLESPPSRVATAWAGSASDQETAPLDRMSLITIGNSAFGLFSNARTVARWGRSLFTGSVLEEATRARMLELVPAAGNIPGESGAGLGIRGYGFLGGTQYGHSGGSPLGSSLLIYDPDTGITLAVLMNQGSGADHFVLAPELLAIAREAM